MKIQHNMAAMNANRQLGIATDASAKNMERLSSGYRINRAADDAAGLAISEKMRSQIRGLSMGIRNTEDGISLCHVADGALNEVHAMMNRLKELSVQAANGTNCESDREMIQDEVEQILEEVDRIGNDTEFNTMPIFRGGTESVDTGLGSVPFQNFVLANIGLGLEPLKVGRDINIMNLAASVNDPTSVLHGTEAPLLYGSGSTSNSSIRITVNGESTVLKLDGSRQEGQDGGWSFANTFFNDRDNHWHKTYYLRYLQSTGVAGPSIRIEQHIGIEEISDTEKNYVVTYKFSTSDDVDKLEFLFHADTAYNGEDDYCEMYYVNDTKLTNACVYDTGTDLVGTNTSQYVYNEIPPENFKIYNENAPLQYCEKISFQSGEEPDCLSIGYWNEVDKWAYYDDLDDKLNSIENSDLGFAMYYDLSDSSRNNTVTFKYGICSQVPVNPPPPPLPAVTTKHSNNLNLWIQSGPNKDEGMYLTIGEMNTKVLGISDLDVSTFDGAQNALKAVDIASKKVSSIRSKIGAQQNRLEHTVLYNENTRENTTAAESRIRDADMAEEMVSNAKYNILTQTAQSMLSQVNKIITSGPLKEGPLYVMLKRDCRKDDIERMCWNMGNNVAIGIQNFAELIEKKCFYIDKTMFIKEWWESNDSVTLITRPRRFGKTLNMSMLEQFFSVDYAERGNLFEGLSIWQEESYRKLQGTYPVISLSFARVKENNYADVRGRLCEILRDLYIRFSFVKDAPVMTEADKTYFDRMLATEIGTVDAASSLYHLSDYLYRYYGKKVVILLDEYDTPMQEAYVNGYWEELVAFTRSLFNSTFKTNPWLERGLMTGITRVSKESVFSDLNNLNVVSTTSDAYAASFGFTEEEVFEALDNAGLSEEKQKVKEWYDGFTFGAQKDIYNPWSIINFIDTQRYTTHWANTSANSLVGKLIREGTKTIKVQFEHLLKGGTVVTPIDEQIVYNQLEQNSEAVWSLLLASGYLKVISYENYRDISVGAHPNYTLALTNLEVKLMFQRMVRDWFGMASSDYNDFINALLIGDVDAMNEYMNRVALSTFSYFDTGTHGEEPERFYHGFVLGLLVELQNRYAITSNRESGFGRYDVMLEPKNPQKDDGIILEFKAFNKRRENCLEVTLASALKQIEEKRYAAQLVAKGIPAERIRRYGLAFEGKQVLIGE